MSEKDPSVSTVLGKVGAGTLDDLFSWTPASFVSFWHFLVWMDQVVATQIIILCQKFRFFPDIFAIECCIGIFVLFIIFLFRKKIGYVFVLIVILFIVSQVHPV